MTDCTNIPASVTSLELNNHSKLTSLANIQNAPNLKEVILHSCENITHCSQLANCKYLIDINIECCKRIKDFAFLNQIKTVLNIRIVENDLQQMVDVSQLGQLQKLNLGGNQIKIIDVSRLPKQKLILLLMDNQISEITDLSQLLIEELYLNRNLIRHVSADKLCKSLKKLYFSGNENLKDFSFIQQCQQLIGFIPCDNKHFDDTQLHYVSFLTRLKVLNIENTSLTSLTPLIPLKDIEQLFINNCKITDPNQLVCLSAMSLLKYLYCHGNAMCLQNNFMEMLAQFVPDTIKVVCATYEEWNKIQNCQRDMCKETSEILKLKKQQEKQIMVPLTFTDHFYPIVEVLEKCSKISILNCQNADVTIYSTQQFENLEEVCIKNCSNVSKIEFKNQPSLICIAIQDCDAQSIIILNCQRCKSISIVNTHSEATTLKELRELKELDMCGSNTNHFNIAGISDTLQALNLSKSFITDRDLLIVMQFINLQCLNLSSTNISVIAPLYNLSKLQELFLSNCKIQDAEQLQILKRFNQLKRLNLSGNPICKYENILRLLAYSINEKVSEVFVINDNSCKQLQQMKQSLIEHSPFTQPMNETILNSMANLQVNTQQLHSFLSSFMEQEGSQQVCVQMFCGQVKEVRMLKQKVNEQAVQMEEMKEQIAQQKGMMQSFLNVLQLYK